jgi:hypothetical protein
MQVFLLSTVRGTFVLDQTIKVPTIGTAVVASYLGLQIQRTKWEIDRFIRIMRSVQKTTAETIKVSLSLSLFSGLAWCGVACHVVVSCCVVSCRVVSCRNVLCCVLLHVVSCFVLCRVVLRRVLLLSCIVLPCLVFSCPIKSTQSIGFSVRDPKLNHGNQVALKRREIRWLLKCCPFFFCTASYMRTTTSDIRITSCMRKPLPT